MGGYDRGCYNRRVALRIFLLGVLVFLVMAPAYYIALASPYFSALWWWDIPLHLLGGAWACCIGAWFIVVGGNRPNIFQCMVFTVFCGVSWEILEAALGISANPVFHPLVDLIKDFIVDAIGGYAAFLSLRVLKAI